MIYRRRFTRGNVIDTCRIFETSFDFWDQNGDGWDILKSVPGSHSLRPLGNQSPTEAESVVAFCSWLAKSSSPELKDNFIEFNVRRIINVANDDVADFLNLLLGLNPAGTLYDSAITSRGHSNLLHIKILRQNWKIVKLLLAQGADPHFVKTNRSYSPVAESPLSFAIYSSWAFYGFRDALHGIDFDVKDFAREELEEGRPLLDAGWQMETLTALLELDFEPDVPPHNGRLVYLCDSCNQRLHFAETAPYVMVQPYWQSFLESVKSGVSPHDLCSYTKDEQPSNNQRNLIVLNDSTTDIADDGELSQDPTLSEDKVAHPNEESPTNGVDISNTQFDRKEIWCVWCWHHFKETGRRWSPASETYEDDASEDDFSPYLIHT